MCESVSVLGFECVNLFECVKVRMCECVLCECVIVLLRECVVLRMCY